MAGAAQLDETDREILDLLEADARRTLTDIGAHVSLSAPAVKRRIDRLEADGVITGWTITVDPARLGRPLDAFTELRFSGSTTVDEIIAIASKLPEVEAVFTTAGDPDALVWVRAEDISHLKHVIDSLRRNGRVMGTKTLMVLETWRQRQPHPPLARGRSPREADG